MHYYVQAKNTGSKTGLPTNKVLASKGIWVVTQEQDSYGGGFASYQSLRNAVAQINVWNYVLPENSIEALSYGATNIEGNLLRWSDAVANYNPIAYFTATPFHLYLPGKSVKYLGKFEKLEGRNRLTFQWKNMAKDNNSSRFCVMKYPCNRNPVIFRLQTSHNNPNSKS